MYQKIRQHHEQERIIIDTHSKVKSQSLHAVYHFQGKYQDLESKIPNSIKISQRALKNGFVHGDY